MNEIRQSHGCTTTYLDNSKVVLVVGGYDENNYLDTMEMYDPLKNEWKVHSTRLPLPLQGLQVVNSHSLNRLAYAIGGFGFGGSQVGSQTAIYGLSRTEKWELVGNLKQKRYYHASLNIKSNEFQVCN